MKQSFLNSLVGKSRKEAKAIVEEHGHVFYPVPSGTAITMILRPNTVIAWHSKGVITGAKSGDGIEE